MRVFVSRIQRAPAAFGDHRTCYPPALLAFSVALLQRLHNERSDRGSGLSSLVAQPLVQGFGNVDCGADGHDIIMSR